MNQIELINRDCKAIISYHGAELKSLTKGDREYMWCADPKFWARTAPVLFPFVGAVNNGEFTYKGNKYPMGQHGFARDMEFELIENTDSTVSFCLKSNDETRKKYPLDFEFISGYRLEENKLWVDWKVINTGKEDLEFSIGAHPAFSCILDKTEIRLTKNGRAVSSFVNSVFGKGLLTDNKAEVIVPDGVMQLDEHSFDGDAYVIENNQVDCVEVMDKGGKPYMSVEFSSPLVGIWSPPTKNAPFLCIEPWYGRADKEGFVGELKDREWNNTLKTNEEFVASYSINLF